MSNKWALRSKAIYLPPLYRGRHNNITLVDNNQLLIEIKVNVSYSSPRQSQDVTYNAYRHWDKFAMQMLLTHFTVIPANTKHLYNICTMLDRRRRRLADVVQLLTSSHVTMHAQSLCARRSLDIIKCCRLSDAITIQITDYNYVCHSRRTWHSHNSIKVYLINQWFIIYNIGPCTITIHLILIQYFA